MPKVFVNSNVEYNNKKPNTEGHGIDVDLVHQVQGPLRVQTNVRLVYQKMFLLELNKTNAQVGEKYWIRTTEHVTKPAKPTFQWLSAPFEYREYSRNPYVR